MPSLPTTAETKVHEQIREAQLHRRLQAGKQRQRSSHPGCTTDVIRLAPTADLLATKALYKELGLLEETTRYGCFAAFRRGVAGLLPQAALPGAGMAHAKWGSTQYHAHGLHTRFVDTALLALTSTARQRAVCRWQVGRLSYALSNP